MKYAVIRPRTGAALALAGLACAMFACASAQAAPAVAPALAAAALGQQGGYGTIKGRLVWGGDTVPPPAVLVEVGKAAQNPNICAREKKIVSRELTIDPKTKGIAFAFAYLQKPKGANDEAVKKLVADHPEVVLDQKNCEFLPYVLPLHTGQALHITSSDPVNHNVHLTAFTNASSNTILPPKGDLKLNLKPERRPIRIGCDIHPWMRSYVMVFDHPFFATTGTDGSFEIQGAPAGPQKLVVWQEKVGYATPGRGTGMPITVKAGETVDVGDITLDPAKVKK